MARTIDLMRTTDWTTYDELTGPELDPERWVPADFGTGPLLEPDARTTVADGVVEVEIPQLRNASTDDQGLDNTKHLLFSTAAFPIPERGVARFGADLRSATRDVSGDYRLGFASFTLADLAGGTNRILAILSTGERLFAEEELLPGHPREEPFTRIVEDPFFRARNAVPDHGFRRCEIEVDRSAGRVRYLVDDHLLHEAGGIADLPEEVHLAFGFFTLLPLGEGDGSAHGQGARAWWRDFRTHVRLRSCSGSPRDTAGALGMLR